MTEDSGVDFSRRDWLKTVGAAGAAGAVGVGAASAQSVGNGGYHDGPPTGAPTHNYERHTTAAFGDRPVPTNDWYSSIPLAGIAGPNVLLAALPLIFRTLEGGLAVGHPQNWTTDWNASDQVGNAVMDGDTQLTISHADAGTYGDVALDDHGDWSASAVFGEGTASSLRVTLAQGSPFVFCEHDGGVELSVAETPTVFADQGNVLRVSVAGRDYGLYAPSGQDWTVDGSTITNAGSYCTVAVLPDTSYLGTYESYAYNRITDTVYDWAYDQSAAEVRTTFTFETQSLPESAATGTITALFPHQWKYSNAPDIDATYPSARGEMRISSGSSFTVSYDYGGMLPFLPPTGNYDQTRLEGLIQGVDESIQGGIDQDTYRFGKDTGSRLSKVAGVADQIGLDGKRDALLDSVRSGLEEWFTPSQSATFYYDDSLGVLQGVQGSHGSVTDVSDHHFHFGHYVWAAARIARHDPTWADQSNWGGMVEELISDYANPDRTSTKYPFNRNFSVYEGHSWAHGSGAFGAGNNQESSSEALMAYAALIEWGEYTGNTQLRDWGIALYATHVRAIQEYWYDLDDANFPSNWEADFAGIVWGNSVAHSTWWTADSEAVYGINMLPMSGYSLHLGRDTQAADRTFQQISALKNDEFTYWPDILWLYRAFSDPQDAIDRFEARFSSYSPEAAQPKGHTLYWLYNLQALGSVNDTVTADTPMYAVFDDGSERTYVAYNADDTATTVTFSDGTTLSVPANSLASTSGSSGGTDPNPTPEQTPYLDTPHAVPGRIQAQHYDDGGQGVAYNDTTQDNQGGAFRTGESVDIQTASDSTGGSYNVGWTAGGEWLEYTVDVRQAGTYDLDIRVASAAGGGTLSVSAGGSTVVGSVALPDTGGWQTVTVSGVALEAGQQVLRLSVDAGGLNLNWVEFTQSGGGGSPGEQTYSGATGEGWSATVTAIDADTSEWAFEPTNAAGWADVQFADPGTDAWVGYRMDDADGDNVHVHTRDASGDGSEIDFRFVWDDGSGGQYVSDRRTHTY